MQWISVPCNTKILVRTGHSVSFSPLYFQQFDSQTSNCIEYSYLKTSHRLFKSWMRSILSVVTKILGKLVTADWFKKFTHQAPFNMAALIVLLGSKSCRISPYVIPSLHGQTPPVLIRSIQSTRRFNEFPNQGSIKVIIHCWNLLVVLIDHTCRILHLKYCFVQLSWVEIYLSSYFSQHWEWS